MNQGKEKKRKEKLGSNVCAMHVEKLVIILKQKKRKLTMNGAGQQKSAKYMQL